MLHSNSFVYLTVSSLACVARCWAELCRNVFIPNSSESGAERSKKDNALISYGFLLGAQVGSRRYTEVAINEYCGTRSNHC